MFRSATVLACFLAATSAMAADTVKVKPRLIHSQMILSADKVVQDGEEFDVKNARRTEPGTGAGLGLEVSLNDRARLGSELSYTEFSRDGSKAFDTGLGGYLAYDFLKTDALSLYATAGLTAHQFGAAWYRAATLVNADAGVGVSLAASDSVDFGAEYKYSQSIVKGELESKAFSGDKIKGVGQERSDYSLLVAMKF